MKFGWQISYLLENLQVLLESYIILLVGNIQFWGIFQVETLFQKLWVLLYKRAELDLRLTKLISVKSGLTKTGLTAKCTIFVCNGFECFIGWELGNNL